MLAVPFFSKHTHLLTLVFPNLSLALGTKEFRGRLSSGTILLQMLTGCITCNVKREKAVFVCDNAHCLDLQSWASLRTLFKLLRKNFFLVLAQRAITKHGKGKEM